MLKKITFLSQYITEITIDIQGDELSRVSHTDRHTHTRILYSAQFRLKKFCQFPKKFTFCQLKIH